MTIEQTSFATLADVEARLAAGDSFVINQIAEWCPDCTVRQRPALKAFEQALMRGGLPLLTVCVQETRGDYLSEEHARLSERIGGAGYPRTLLVHNGQPATTDSGLNRVEVMSEQDLIAFAEAMIASL